MAIHPDLKRAVPKTKNTAKDYNDNFDKMINFVDATLLECKTYVDAYMPDQSGQAGKFLTTNGTIASWVNLGLYIPAASYIDGLVITKVNDTTIGVSTGSCFDDTKTIILSLSSDVTKTKENPGANATYYVYIIGTGSSTDILISDSTNPQPPSGYIYKRQIGSYKTDENGAIASISFYGVPANSDKSSQIQSFFPDYTAGVSMTVNTDNTATEDGWVKATSQVQGGGGTVNLTINGETIRVAYAAGGTAVSGDGTVICPIKKNDVYNLKSGTLTFYPMRSN